MKQLTNENILKNQVDTIEQFKVFDYLKKQLSIDAFSIYLIDRYTIKVIDKNKAQGYFKYNSKNKYGYLSLHYLKENNKPLYTTLLMKNELTNHLVSVSIEAENRLNSLMEQYKNSDKLLSEKNKMDNQLQWVKLMNNYKNIAEEVILKELIYI